MSTAVFAGFILLSFVLALRARRGAGAQSVHDFFVASRQLGTFLVFFLAAGEIYSVATMVGFAEVSTPRDPLMASGSLAISCSLIH
jgi:SSS family solute:Na+ symporter